MELFFHQLRYLDKVFLVDRNPICNLAPQSQMLETHFLAIDRFECEVGLFA
jgi:hypothetical protein